MAAEGQVHADGKKYRAKKPVHRNRCRHRRRQSDTETLLESRCQSIGLLELCSTILTARDALPGIVTAIRTGSFTTVAAYSYRGAFLMSKTLHYLVLSAFT